MHVCKLGTRGTLLPACVTGQRVGLAILVCCSPCTCSVRTYVGVYVCTHTVDFIVRIEDPCTLSAYLCEYIDE